MLLCVIKTLQFIIQNSLESKPRRFWQSALLFCGLAASLMESVCAECSKPRHNTSKSTKQFLCSLLFGLWICKFLHTQKKLWTPLALSAHHHATPWVTTPSLGLRRLGQDDGQLITIWNHWDRVSIRDYWGYLGLGLCLWGLFWWH